MRQPEPQRYAVVVPGHVSQLLACLPEKIANALREGLYDEAVRAARFGSFGEGLAQRMIEVEGARLHYEQDNENKVLIALDVIGDFPRPH